MALVLTRRMGESIQIGKDITVTIAPSGHHNQVRVIIDAPRDVSIVRTELLGRQERRK